MGTYQPNSSSKKLYEKIDNFTGGINIVDESIKLGDNEFRNLENISLTSEGSVKKRTGYQEIFNFRNSPYFKILYGNDVPTHYETSVNFPTGWNQVRDNTQQILSIIDHIKQFRLIGYEKHSLKIGNITSFSEKNFNLSDFIIEDSDDEKIKNKDWDTIFFNKNYLSDNNETTTENLNTKYFNFNSFVYEISNFNLDLDWQEYITTITTSKEEEKQVTIKIGNQYKETFIIDIESLKDTQNIKWISDIINVNKVVSDSLEFIKFEEVYSDPINYHSKELLGYLIAYTYNKKLWFTFYDLKNDEYILLEWFLINNEAVNDYKFIADKDEEGNIIKFSLAEIQKNSKYYYNPNLTYNKEEDIFEYPYVGVDIITYRNNIYIVTGYGILETNYNDILIGNIYEIIPFKPQTSEYQNNYSNLLSLNLKSDEIITNNLKTKFENIWNWDWVEWPKTTHLSGIISKYPPNSKYPIVLRSSINFTDESMVSKWQYQWRWAAPQEMKTGEGTKVDETMPIIKDFQTYNYELNWKPIVRPETVNNYVITNPEVQTTKQPFTDESTVKVGANSTIRHFPNFYLGGDNGEPGSALKYKIDKIVQQLTNDVSQYKTLDLLGNMLINVELKADSNTAKPIKLQPCTMSNWRIEVYLNDTLLIGDDTQGSDWKEKGWWKLQTTNQEWGENTWYLSGYHNYNHKTFPLSIINSEKFLKTVKEKSTGSTNTGYIKILCDLNIGQYANVVAPFNTTATFKINPNTSQWNSNGLTFGLGYVPINVSDSNTIGLIPIDNIEQQLNLESLHLVKECTQMIIIKDQVFIWGSKSAPQLIWYSQPFNPGYISVINTIALNRLSNEIVKAIEPFGQNFLIFTDRTIYIMKFTDKGIYIEIGNPNYGIEFRNSVTGVGNTILFLSYDGIYQIRSSGMDINNTIKIKQIDRKIKGLIDFQDIKHAVATSEGENYWLLVGNSNKQFKILNYYTLRDIWTQNTTNHNFNFKQLQNIQGKIYSFTQDGILNQWYTQIDEKLLLNRTTKYSDSNEFLLKVMQLYSDGYKYKQTRLEKKTNSEKKPELKIVIKNNGTIEELDVFKHAPIQSLFKAGDEYFYKKIDENKWKYQDEKVNIIKTDEEIYQYWYLVPDNINYLGILYVNFIPNYSFFNIECEILTKEFSGAQENTHNKKKFKEIQLKQIKNVFATRSELTWYTDGIENIYPYKWITDVEGEYFVSIKKIINNYQLNSGSYVNESFFVTDLNNLPEDKAYLTNIGDNTEYNSRFKKGQKSYTTQIKLVNRECLPFGLKSLLLVYKLRKAK